MLSTAGPLGVQPARVVSDLRELAAWTGGPDGARRLAWTDGWVAARQWLLDKLEEISCAVRRDPAGNLLAEIVGVSPGFIAVGSHLDSVPAGGWLDGALGVLAGIEILRTVAARPDPPPVGIRVIDWADEEGARFGHSLFGSSAVAGVLAPRELGRLTDRDGVTVEEALRACGVEIENAAEARHTADDLLAYLELHIEQGPVLERASRRLAVVTGTTGVDRRILHLLGEAAHAGAAPMDARRDPVVAAARAVGRIVELATDRGATATFGTISCQPGVETIVPERCDVAVDLRHPDPAVLAELASEVDGAVANVCRSTEVEFHWELQWHIEPIPFEPQLLELAVETCTSVGADPLLMHSGALHDAASMARLAPTVMLFCPSRGGISHSPQEDTAPEDLELGVLAMAALTARAMEWAAVRGVAP